MEKTGSDVEDYIYQLLRHSDLAGIINGTIYKEGLRPRDSETEDAVVIFTAGLPGQTQTGIVTVNIFVPDIDPYDSGVTVKDGERCREIEAASQQWVDSLTAGMTNGYLIRLNDTIKTEDEPEIRQHFVAIKLKYKYANS